MINNLKNKIIRLLIKNTWLESPTCRMVINQMNKTEIELMLEERKK